jgi:hypothetical protein
MTAKNFLHQYGNNDKAVSWFTWAIVCYSIVISLVRFPITSPAIFGDEGTYRAEVEHLAQYGFYNALSQGTSFIYTCLIFVCSKIFTTNYLVTMRLLTFIFYVVSCKLLLKCFEQFEGVGVKEKYFGLAFFAAISLSWLKEGLPDMIDVACMLGSSYLVLKSKNYGSLALAGIILFLGFACKPVVVFIIPGLMLVLFFKSDDRLKNIGRMAVFTAAFGACFVLYHMPGYRTYHKLMLEDKDHYYENGARMQNKTTWRQRNVYFEMYNVNNRPSQWHVTWDEVDSFKRQHPDISLELSSVDILKQYPSKWVGKFSNKVFMFLPYNLQRGFFFFLWTLVNKVIRNIYIIGILTSVIIFTFFIAERKFIARNIVAFSIPGLYFLGLSFYIITPLQGNWLLFCMPFFALPVTRLLPKYVNILVLLALQFVFMLTL